MWFIGVIVFGRFIVEILHFCRFAFDAKCMTAIAICKAVSVEFEYINDDSENIRQFPVVWHSFIG